MQEAEELYEKLLSNARRLIDEGKIPVSRSASSPC